jgi:DNA-directed RNA polymerase subunit RPC12/RpoP
MKQFLNTSPDFDKCPNCGKRMRKDTETYFFCLHCQKLFELIVNRKPVTRRAFRRC